MSNISNVLELLVITYLEWDLHIAQYQWEFKWLDR